MDQGINLAHIVRRVVQDYDGPAIGSKTYYIEDPERQYYLVMVIPDNRRLFKARAVFMAHIADELIFIDEDTTDRPLYKELMRAGIPRQKIILSYAGEEILNQEAKK